MKALLFFSLLFFLYNDSLSQEFNGNGSLDQILVKGRVLSIPSEEAVSGALVRIFASNEVKSLTSTVSNAQGYFQIFLPAKTFFSLKVSHVGFKEKELKIQTLQSGEQNLGVIFLPESIFDIPEVVKQAAPLEFIQERNKTIILLNIDEDAQYISVYDLMLKAPFISMDPNDNLSFNGKTVYEFFINGKPSNMMADNINDILRAIPGKIIKEIEIWHTPPPMFRNYGDQPIINILLRNDYLSGLTIGNNLSFNQIPEKTSENKSFRENIFINKKQGKLSLNFNGNLNEQWNPLSANNSFRYDSLTKRTLDQTSRSKTKSNTSQFAANVSYEIDSLKEIRWSINLSQAGNNTSSSQEFINGGSEVSNQRLITNQNDSKVVNGKTALNYQQIFGKEGENRWVTEISQFRQASSGLIKIKEANFSDNLNDEELMNNKMEYDDFNWSYDIFQKIKSLELESGLSFQQSKESRTYTYENLNPLTGVFIADEEYSSFSKSNFQTFNTYLGGSKGFDKGSVNAGINFEISEVKGTFSDNIESIKKKYNNYLPYLNVFILTGEESSLNLSYNKSWEIPDLFYLNPFIDKSDPFNIRSGNLNLKPSQNHNFSAGFSKKIKNIYPNLRVSYSLNQDRILSYTRIENEINYITFENIGKNQSLNFAFNSNIKLSKTLNFNYDLNSNLLIYESNVSDDYILSKRWTYNASGNLRYTHNKRIRMNYSVNYFSNSLNFLELTQSMFRSNFNMQVDLGKRKTSNLQLTINNPQGNSRIVRTEIFNPNFYQVSENSSVIRRFTLTYQMRFNRFR